MPSKHTILNFVNNETLNKCPRPDCSLEKMAECAEKITAETGQYHKLLPLCENCGKQPARVLRMTNNGDFNLCFDCSCKRDSQLSIMVQGKTDLAPPLAYRY